MNSTNSKRIGIIIAMICIMALIITIINVIITEDTYSEADDKLAESIVMSKEVHIKNNSKDYSKYYNKSDITDTDNSEYYVDISKAKNIILDDAVAWITIPDTPIDYIVMQGDIDNTSKYLWKDPYGNDSKTGSLFTRYNDFDDNDVTTVIYGHRLKNHDIYFGPLMQYTNKDYAVNHDKVIIYRGDCKYTYTLKLVCNGLDNDLIYMYPYEFGSVEHELLLNELNERAIITLNDGININSKLLVLSTCSGVQVNRPERLYLIFEEDI